MPRVVMSPGVAWSLRKSASACACTEPMLRSTTVQAKTNLREVSDFMSSSGEGEQFSPLQNGDGCLRAPEGAKTWLETHGHPSFRLAEHGSDRRAWLVARRSNRCQRRVQVSSQLRA